MAKYLSAPYKDNVDLKHTCITLGIDFVDEYRNPRSRSKCTIPDIDLNPLYVVAQEAIRAGISGKWDEHVPALRMVIDDIYNQFTTGVDHVTLKNITLKEFANVLWFSLLPKEKVNMFHVYTNWFWQLLIGDEPIHKVWAHENERNFLAGKGVYFRWTISGHMLEIYCNDVDSNMTLE